MFVLLDAVFTHTPPNPAAWINDRSRWGEAHTKLRGGPQTLYMRSGLQETSKDPVTPSQRVILGGAEPLSGEGKKAQFCPQSLALFPGQAHLEAEVVLFP